MLFGSVCSGIEAASVAWSPLGWKAAWFSEIEPFPCAVLAHHFPDVANMGDMTTLPDRIANGEVFAPDVLCGGTPCQAFSVAGKRQSLDDHRGNLTLTFCDIADAIDETRSMCGDDPCVVFWENVPGVLSTKDNAFGCFLGRLVGSDVPLSSGAGKWPSVGYVTGPKRKAAWRVLDAQYFGVPQRRRRVFVVASARDGFDPTKILFEQSGLRGDSEKGRTTGKDTPAFTLGGFASYREGVGTLKAQGGDLGGGSETLVVREFTAGAHGVCYPIDTMNITERGDGSNGMGIGADGDPSYTLSRGHHHGVATPEQVRRLTPVECERLQGFPDNWTRIPYRGKSEEMCPDSPRYKAIGNSWAVPCVRWIGERLDKHLKEIAK